MIVTTQQVHTMIREIKAAGWESRLGSAVTRTENGDMKWDVDTIIRLYEKLVASTALAGEAPVTAAPTPTVESPVAPTPAYATIDDAARIAAAVLNASLPAITKAATEAAVAAVLAMQAEQAKAQPKPNVLRDVAGKLATGTQRSVLAGAKAFMSAW